MSATHDVFGIKKIYKSKDGGPEWDARHWVGCTRTIKSGQRDPEDPTQCSENRGNVDWTIDGDGLLIFNGTKSSGITEPRFHLNRPEKYFFRDVECTFYMMRIEDNNTNWGGAIVGVRSGPNGHSSSSEYCDAHTYYNRMRFDGKMDFEKELKHPDSSVKLSEYMWPNNSRFPYNKWVGYKSVVRNAGNGVKLQLFLDTTEGANGGTWVKLGEIGDVSGWAPPQVAPACPYPSDFVPLEGGGVIVLRNTGVTNCMYKWFSVREITSSYVFDDYVDTFGEIENIIATDVEDVEIIACESCTTDKVELSSGCVKCEEGQCFKKDENEGEDEDEDEDEEEDEDEDEEEKDKDKDENVGWISWASSFINSLY